ncbi:DEAD/DEAH box helicase [Candidatus Micrarchaeota archaeon]|nr:DEAD/DEAH box helicase [Candidatus Micrarchaeota archaeon]
MGYNVPTEVQERALPLMVSGKELIVRSKTGSGKTLAFGSGALQMLELKKARKALILAPVRELALQIMSEIRAVGKFCPYRVICAYGGQDIDMQINLIYRGVDILVATPGRLLDLFERGIIDLNDFDFVVVDEADKMFEMGFAEDVDKILSNTSYARKLQFFSATITNEIKHMYTKYVKEYEVVEVGQEEKPPQIKEEKINIERPDKFNKLVEIIKEHRAVDKTGKILVFVATQRATEYLGRRLKESGISASYIHGDVKQRRRENIMSDFKENDSGILVATDIAARGIHIDDISLVLNYDEAMDAVTHLHRIGRTGRMGAEGKAITFVEENPFYRKPSNPSFRLRTGPYNPNYGKEGNRQYGQKRPYRGPNRGRPSGPGEYSGREERGGYRGQSGHERKGEGEHSGQSGKPGFNRRPRSRTYKPNGYRKPRPKR